MIWNQNVGRKSSSCDAQLHQMGLHGLLALHLDVGLDIPNCQAFGCSAIWNLEFPVGPGQCRTGF